MQSSVIKPELLAPAGDRMCIRAAIENGADAVYFGLQTGFNARARAANFAVEDLPDVMRELHARGVRGYTTLNTLVFSEELAEVEKLIQQIAAAGVDAILVQDLGVVRLVREICPELEIHASTQMTMTSSETIAVAAQLGVSRVVLARELSLDEIRKIASQTSMPLEVFIHGALCVAYSGQCLTSESLGGRSANRGQCAQACRMPYELVCDGKDVDLGDQKYLLSPQDLAAFDLVPELIAAGVASFKIEGRLKTPEYVANITQHYRQAIDAAVAARPLKFSAAEVEEMELSFSRGFSPGWLGGCDHKMLVPGRSSAKRGVLLGEVIDTRSDRVRVKLRTHVAPGDGLVFQGNRAEGEEQGGRVYEIFSGRQRRDSAQAG
jgi:putative protease